MLHLEVGVAVFYGLDYEQKKMSFNFLPWILHHDLKVQGALVCIILYAAYGDDTIDCLEHKPEI